MKRVKVGDRYIGEGEPVFIIAEIGLNHNGSAELARRLIDVAVNAGCDAVKFQKRSPRAMLTREFYESPYTNGGHSFGPTYGAHREALELSEDVYRQLKEYCDRRGILFFASAWDEGSADFLARLDVPLFKIGSPDLTNLPLCEHIAKMGKPIILSTGMSEMREVERAVETILRFNDQLILMHCVSIYPTPVEHVNLGCMRDLAERFGLPVGYSGHEHGIAIPVAAVAMGACAIEKHITLCRVLRGGDHKFSLEPDEVHALVRSIRAVEQALPSREKTVHPLELPARQKLAKSLTSAVRIPRGTVITREMLCCKSPGTGIPPTQIDQVVGRIALADIEEDCTIFPEQVGLGRTIERHRATA